MTERPTPEQIGKEFDAIYGEIADKPCYEFYQELLKHGYRIVHPDDIPPKDYRMGAPSAEWAQGWNACRRHIFGDDR